MRNVRTISISLERAYEEKLAILAANFGGNSAAIRRLLDEHEAAERERRMDEAYRAYFADPVAAEEALQWTRALMSVATLDPPRPTEVSNERRRSAPR